MKMATRLLLLHKKNLKGKAGDYYEIRHICHPSPRQKPQSVAMHCNVYCKPVVKIPRK
jgi:hypothetical protein